MYKRYINAIIIIIKTRESDVTWTRIPNGKANGCSQWFLFLRSAASGLEKPLLAG